MFNQEVFYLKNNKVHSAPILSRKYVDNHFVKSERATSQQEGSFAKLGTECIKYATIHGIYDESVLFANRIELSKHFIGDTDNSECLKHKTQIKRWDTEEIIHEFEGTIKEAVEDAVKNKISLQGANLISANLVDANLQDANLVGAYLKGANLRGAYLQDANLRGAYLASTNLAYTNLSYADFQGAYLMGANLASTNLASTNLKGANLVDANLQGANLAGAIGLDSLRK